MEGRVLLEVSAVGVEYTESLYISFNRGIKHIRRTNGIARAVT